MRDMEQAACNHKFDGDATEGWKNNVNDDMLISMQSFAESKRNVVPSEKFQLLCFL